MDFAGWTLILVVVAIGGGSAWLADIWGHRIGKKRLSFGNLRPKQIARLAVIIMGMILPLLTIGVLWIASSDFRMWLSKGRQAIVELQSKTVELDKVNQSVVDKTKQNATLENRNRFLNAESEKNLRLVNDQKKKLGELSENLRKENAKVVQMQSSLSKLNLLNEQTRKKFAATEKLFQESKKSLDAVQKSLESSKLEYGRASTKYNEMSQRNLLLTSANAELQTKNSDTTQKLAALQDQLAQLSTDVAKLEKDKKTAESQAESAKAEVNEVAKELANIEDRVRELTNVYNERIRALGYLTRTNPVTYLKGEELGRSNLEATTTRADAINTYRGLLRKARTLAAGRGAVADGGMPFSGPAGMIITTASGRALTEDEVEARWVDLVDKQDKANLMLVRAAVNSFTGEPVLLEIQILPNPFVFRKGELIAETRIDARLSDFEVLNKVREFLRTFVNTKARSRNMIPVMGRDGESYGEFTSAQLLETVDRIRRATREVRVVAIATADIRAGDPLQLEIQIR